MSIMYIPIRPARRSSDNDEFDDTKE